MFLISHFNLIIFLTDLQVALQHHGFRFLLCNFWQSLGAVWKPESPALPTFKRSSKQLLLQPVSKKRLVSAIAITNLLFTNLMDFFLLFVLGQSVIYEAVRLIAAWGISELVDPAVARIQKMVSNNSDNNNVRYTSLCCIEKLLQTCSHQRRAQGYLFCHDHFIRRL